MFLSLEKQYPDKGVSLFARDLAGDEEFDPMRSSFLEWDADRSRADRAIGAANRALAPDGHKAFHSLFNQFRWRGTTGWEYWSRDYELMLRHSLVVAAALAVPLHVHAGIVDQVRAAGPACGIAFEIEPAEPVSQPNDGDFVFTNKQIAAGEYFVLKAVVLPPGTPVLEDF